MDARIEPRFTLLDAIEQLFPLAPNPEAPDQALSPYPAWPLPAGSLGNYDPAILDDVEDYFEDMGEPYRAPPMSPMDVFAAAAYILDLGGVYHHFSPAPRRPQREVNRTRSRRLIHVDKPTLNICQMVARAWRRDLDTGDAAAVLSRATELKDLLERWYLLFGVYGLEPVFQSVDEVSTPPAWWSVALELFIMADEAAKGVGFKPLNLAPDKPTWQWFMRDFENEAILAFEQDRSDLLPVSLSCASSDVACVAPKARTSPVGCTLRSLSHHLAPLPPRGVARAQWTPLLIRPGQKIDEDTEFNLLLIPFPYSISDHEFVGSADYNTYRNDWRFFSLMHSWQNASSGPGQDARAAADLLVDFISELATQAQREHRATRIDAVVFPELALDHLLFRELCILLPRRLRDLRVLISGLSSRQGSESLRRSRTQLIERKGNFVGVACFTDGGFELETVREKHHRWMLDRAQISAYALEGSLDPRCSWWEDIDLLSRRVDFTVYRRRSVLAAMICEDLARVDPCQELLRSVGPNLVVALLMDAPQLCTRWPARYATILAEDPGSSVLTLTSRGLMTRQILRNTWPKQSSKRFIVALWRDDYNGVPIEIECPITAHAVWLKLWGRRARDKTLDGRIDNGAVSWVHSCHKPVVIANVENLYGGLIGTKDRELREAAK